MSSTHSHQSAFTLIELSIVLVIIGLIVGGVLVGRDLIKASERRALISEMQSFQTALFTFRGAYNALPGDMANATSYWGAQDGSTGLTSGCFSTISTDQTTCNGDGNGIWDYDGIRYNTEGNRAWQHLANAGLIAGKFNVNYQSTGSATNHTKYPNVGFFLSYATFGGNFGDIFSTDMNGNQMFIGNSNDNVKRVAVFTPSDAFQIDSKIDDGKPDTGKLQTNTTTYNAGCYTGTYPTAAYAISSNNVLCSFRLKVE